MGSAVTIPTLSSEITSLRRIARAGSCIPLMVAVVSVGSSEDKALDVVLELRSLLMERGLRANAGVRKPFRVSAVPPALLGLRMSGAAGCLWGRVMLWRQGVPLGTRGSGKSVVSNLLPEALEIHSSNSAVEITC